MTKGKILQRLCNFRVREFHFEFQHKQTDIFLLFIHMSEQSVRQFVSQSVGSNKSRKIQYIGNTVIPTYESLLTKWAHGLFYMVFHKFRNISFIWSVCR